jgi:hypothetical protein
MARGIPYLERNKAGEPPKPSTDVRERSQN